MFNLENVFSLLISIKNTFLFTLLLLILILGITFYHTIKVFSRDKKRIEELKNFEKSTLKNINLNNLNQKPLINIIIPAWKEGEPFKKCLEAISNLSYPNLQIIVNAGGSEKCINIANSFKTKKKFKIIYQKKGDGKIKAINDCLKYVSEGIIYLIDADILLTDKLFFQVIYSIINQNKDLIVTPIYPHESLLKNDLIKYVYSNRDFRFNAKLNRKLTRVGPHTIFKYKILKSIGKFSEKQNIDDGISLGLDFLKKGIYAYILYEYKAPILSYPQTLCDYFEQNTRWIENSLFFALKTDKIQFLKFLLLFFASIYLLILPLLFLFDLNLFLIGLAYFLNIYLKRVRKILITKQFIPFSLNLLFFFKMIFYIFFDAIINIVVFFEIIFYKKVYEKRKNFL
ncbi:MAG: glycosyltransferase [Promethearchaeota archaeon]